MMSKLASICLSFAVVSGVTWNFFESWGFLPVLTNVIALLGWLYCIQLLIPVQMKLVNACRTWLWRQRHWPSTKVANNLLSMCSKDTLSARLKVQGCHPAFPWKPMALPCWIYTLIHLVVQPRHCLSDGHRVFWVLHQTASLGWPSQGWSGAILYPSSTQHHSSPLQPSASAWQTTSDLATSR